MVAQISLIDTAGKELFRNETSIHPDNPHLNYVGPFIPPKGLFFIRVNGQEDQACDLMRGN